MVGSRNRASKKKHRADTGLIKALHEVIVSDWSTFGETYTIEHGDRFFEDSDLVLHMFQCGQDEEIAIFGNAAANDAIGRRWDEECDWAKSWDFVRYAIASVARVTENRKEGKWRKPLVEIGPGPYYTGAECRPDQRINDSILSYHGSDIVYVRTPRRVEEDDVDNQDVDDDDDADQGTEPICLWHYPSRGECYMLPKLSAVSTLFGGTIASPNALELGVADGYAGVTDEGDRLDVVQVHDYNLDPTSSSFELPIPLDRTRAQRLKDKHVVRPYPFGGLSNACNVQSDKLAHFARDTLVEINETVRYEDADVPAVIGIRHQIYSESSHYTMGHGMSLPAQGGHMTAYGAAVNRTDTKRSVKFKKLKDELEMSKPWEEFEQRLTRNHHRGCRNEVELQVKNSGLDGAYKSGR